MNHATSHASARAIRQWEAVQQALKQLEVIERMQIPRVDERALHRAQDSSTDRSRKSSTKKSVKSVGSSSGAGGDGGDGGDGDGDGDGPQRTRSARKKIRSSKSVITRPSRLPNISSGKTAPTPSPKVSPNRPQPSRGIVIFAMILLFAIVLTKPYWVIVLFIVIGLITITLAEMGHSDVAKVVWRSAVPKLLEYLTKSTDEESEDPDEES